MYNTTNYDYKDIIEKYEEEVLKVKILLNNKDLPIDDIFFINISNFFIKQTELEKQLICSNISNDKLNNFNKQKRNNIKEIIKEMKNTQHIEAK